MTIFLKTNKKKSCEDQKKEKTILENVKLNMNSPTCGKNLESWDQADCMLKNNVREPFYRRWEIQDWYRLSYMLISIILVLVMLILFLPFDNEVDKKFKHHTNYGNYHETTNCMRDCKINIVESIPINMTYPNNTINHPSTFTTWMDLIASARNTIEIAGYYWSMNGEDVYPHYSAKEGEEVFNALIDAGKNRGIQLKIAQSTPNRNEPNSDTKILAKKARAQVRTINFAALLGGGVLHTKIWIIDRTHIYVGSANTDWRSLTQVKELGIVAYNCSCIVHDLGKIFDVYWLLGKTGKIPEAWPKTLSTEINIKTPMNFMLNGNKYKIFFGSSPPQFSPDGRTNDIDGLLYSIENAEKFIHISVMDYFPLTIYTRKLKYWPIIVNALKAAAIERNVNVRLLISKWKHSRPSEKYFLKSLMDLTDCYEGVEIEVKRFVVPSNEDFDKIPFVRVNHNKYMVTDKAAYIGTSNWSGDYFINTAGIGMVFEDADPNNQDSIRQQLQNIFERDWNSPFAYQFNSFEAQNYFEKPKGMLLNNSQIDIQLQSDHILV